VAHTIEQAIFSMNVKMGKFLWHQLNYNICVEGTKRGISNCQKFLFITTVTDGLSF
jgi:hypothetical protein